jgi:hypothetical protein
LTCAWAAACRSRTHRVRDTVAARRVEPWLARRA